MLYDLSTRSDLEPLGTVAEEVQRRARSLDIDVLVIGAQARNLLVRARTGMPPTRATEDLDIAVSVRSWDDVARLTATMTPSPDGAAHRFVVLGVQVDIVPFGAIEAPDRSITWPDDHTMTVLGFREAWEAAEVVLLPNDVVVRIPSLASQSILKTIAWRDRHYADSRDAVDLATLLDVPASPGQVTRLHDEHPDVMTRNDFDPKQAGAEVIGLEAAEVLGGDGAALVLGMISPEPTLDLLAGEMGGRARDRRATLDAFVRGLGRGLS